MSKIFKICKLKFISSNHMSELPKLDLRDSEELLKEVKYLASQYTPEWNFDEHSEDFGVVFAKVFCKMTEGTISRYNKTLYNYYLTFLNMLGTRLRPAASASGMVIVKASGGTKGAYIEKGTALFASADTEDGMVIYETTDPLTAVDTSVKSIYFTDGNTDFIGCVYDNPKEDKIQAIKPFRIFDNVLCENLQKHEIYFEDSTVFNMSDTDIIFSFYDSLSAINQSKLPEIFSDSKNVSWEYYDGKNWIKIQSVQKTDTGVRIKFKGKSAVTEISGKESRFIKCKFKKIPEDAIRVTAVEYRCISSKINADSFFSDDSELSENDFFPFDEEYTMYNRFSLSCDEAFTKKGAMVEVSAQVQFVKIKKDLKIPGKKYKSVMNEVDFANLEPDDIKIEKVKWEYWNGFGWARLETDKFGEEFFKVSEDKETQRTLRFKCPEDMEKISVGSSDGYFIRARISKMSDRFDFYANYITPYVHDLKIKYDYEGAGHQFSSVIVKSDLVDKTVNLSGKKLCSLLEKSLCEYPAMYLCLSKPLIQGMIRIFIDIEEGIHRFNPSVKWEYLSKDGKGGCEWKHIDIVDSTDDFSHSETVTLIGKNDFEKASIFGSEGYFVRIVNPDCKYSNGGDISGRTVINDIKFNAVRVLQKATRPAEYFSIESGHENKLCKLSYSNAADAEVWVNELGTLSVTEQEKFLEQSGDKTQVEYNEFGQPEKLWIKWEAVPNLVAFGMNDRVYEIDYPKGEILFGNGRNGKIPPEQYNESIKIKYSVCNGTKGNVNAYEIKDFMDTMAHVDGVYNPYPIMGGVNMETINSAAKRMFGQISGGNRLVSLSDFEQSICYNDRNIYKIKCLAHVDEESNPCIGITSLAVLPRVYMQGYEKFQGIKNRIWKFLDEKAPAPLSNSSRIRVFEVGYVETSVNLDVVIEDFNFYQAVYSGIELKLKKFLDPVRGNFSGNGWDIGQFPKKEFIYNYIKTVPHIKWIKNINIFTNLITAEGKKELDFESIKKQKFVVPVFGSPNINITVN